MSADATVLTLQKTRYSIRISQAVAGSSSHQDFEYLLRSVRYAHDPLRPSVDQYSAYVSVSVSDGALTSLVAITTIDVFVTNTPPVVFIDGERNVSAVMLDGEMEIRLDGVVTLFDDSTRIQQVSMTLTNPSHSDEQIRISPANITGFTVVSEPNRIVLIGPATPAEFSLVLTESTFYYEYPPMDSILMGDRPDFTTR